jgi:hypothetical protein
MEMAVWLDVVLLGPEDEVFASSNLLLAAEWVAWFGIVQAKAVGDDSSNVKSTEERALQASQYLKTPMQKGTCAPATLQLVRWFGIFMGAGV